MTGVSMKTKRPKYRKRILLARPCPHPRQRRCLELFGLFPLLLRDEQPEHPPEGVLVQHRLPPIERSALAHHVQQVAGIRSARLDSRLIEQPFDYVLNRTLRDHYLLLPAGLSPYLCEF